jgi:hypothetical protein
MSSFFLRMHMPPAVQQGRLGSLPRSSKMRSVPNEPGGMRNGDADDELLREFLGEPSEIVRAKIVIPGVGDTLRVNGRAQ